MTSHPTAPYRLMAPGPVPLPSKVQEILSLPMIHHRTPEFTAILQRCLEGLKPIFQTQKDVFILSSTGSGAMEAALVNTLSPGDEILSICSGKFGERWTKMAQVFGYKVHCLDVPWGKAVDVEKVESYLKANPQVKAVLCQACETSTATTHPIEALARVIRQTQPECLFIVDAITAIGAMPLPMDTWDLDIVVAGSQKAFMLPTGLGFISLSERAWRAQEKSKTPRFYFDLKAEQQANKRGETLFSSSVSLIRALDWVIAEFNHKGLDSFIRRCELLADCTRSSAQSLGLQVYSQAPSSSVTAIQVPDGIDGVALRRHIEEKYAVTFMGGQDQLKGKIVRIGHLGAISNEDVVASIRSLGLALKDLGWPHFNEDQLTQTLNSLKSRLTC